MPARTWPAALLAGSHSVDTPLTLIPPRPPFCQQVLPGRLGESILSFQSPARQWGGRCLCQQAGWVTTLVEEVQNICPPSQFLLLCPGLAWLQLATCVSETNQVGGSPARSNAVLVHCPRQTPPGVANDSQTIYASPDCLAQPHLLPRPPAAPNLRGGRVAAVPRRRRAGAAVPLCGRGRTVHHRLN